MYIFSNAVKNIGRNKGRNILMAIILFAIILTTAVSIIINTTTAAIIGDYKTKFGAQVYLTLDANKIKSVSMEDFKQPSAEDYFKFGESDLLQKKEFTGNNMIIMTEYKGLDEGSTQGLGGSAQSEGGAQEGYKSPNATLKAFSRSDINDEFKNGLREIVEGKMASANGEVIISEALAELNGLKVGSTIQIKNMSVNTVAGQAAAADTLTVSGIYRDNTPEDTNKQYTLPITNRGNELITTLDIYRALAVNKDGSGMSEISAAYYLKDPGMLEAFQKELYQKGLPEYYKASADEAGYHKVVGPVEGLAKITNVFLIVVLALGSVILILLSTLSIRERKYEVGVLRAMGMKKGKVALGMLSEMLVITAACLVVGLGAGALVAQPVADVLLQNQISAAEQDSSGGETELLMGDMGNTDSAAQQPLSEVNIQLTGPAVAEITLIALLLAGISSVVGIVFITKYEPMKILSERN